MNRGVVLLAVGLTCPVLFAETQAPRAGRPDFSGTWTLDAYLSDHPAQVAQAIRIDTGQPGGQEVFRGGPENGRIGAGRRGTEPGRGEGTTSKDRAAADPMRPEDRKTITELTDAVRFASPTLTIVQTDADITIASARGGSQTIHTNGKAEKQSLNGGAVDRGAGWEGPILAVRYEVGRAGTLVYTYSMVPTTKQLLIRVNFERVPDQPGPFDIKLVYNRVAAK